jgi:hypothetical protein
VSSAARLRDDPMVLADGVRPHEVAGLVIDVELGIRA